MLCIQCVDFMFKVFIKIISGHICILSISPTLSYNLWFLDHIPWDLHKWYQSQVDLTITSPHNHLEILVIIRVVDWISPWRGLILLFFHISHHSNLVKPSTRSKGFMTSESLVKSSTWRKWSNLMALVAIKRFVGNSKVH